MSQFKGVTYLTEDQFRTLSETGSLEVGGVTYTYKPDERIYVTNSNALTEEDLSTDLQNKINDKQDQLTAGERIVITDNVIKSVTNYIDLVDVSGNLNDDEYTMLQNDDMVVLRRSGVIYRLTSKPLNGVGDYIFISEHYDTGEIESYKPYAIVLKQDKSWTWKIIDSTQSDESSTPVFLTLNAKETAINGQLTPEELALLQSTNDAHIIFNNERYDLQDIQHTSGTLTFTHKGLDTLNDFFTKCITITINTRAWTLIEQGTDNTPTENSKNLITSGAVYTANTLKADVNASNINVTQFLGKLNIAQDFQYVDGTNILRFGSLMLLSKTFSITGNAEQVWTFPIAFSNTYPMCWCNSNADGQSANNSSAVTASSNTSMTVRACGTDATVTMFALGWKTN